MEPLNSSGWSIPNGLGYLDNPGPVPLSQLTDGHFRPSTEPFLGAFVSWSLFKSCRARMWSKLFRVRSQVEDLVVILVCLTTLYYDVMHAIPFLMNKNKEAEYLCGYISGG
jgi:hypothetical protein